MQTGIDVINVGQTAKRTAGMRSSDKTYKLHETAERNRTGQKRRHRKKIRLIYRGIACLLGIAILLAAATIYKGLNYDTNTKQYAEITQTFQPNRPKVIESYEVLDELKILTSEYPQFREIYDNADLYPEKLIAALCNNPEMYEFVKGYPSSDNRAEDGITDGELSEAFPLFLQWDRRWGYSAYGDSMIGLSGCGPTCLSMVIVSLTKNADATPDKIAAYSMENGHYVEGTGTAWSLMTDAVSQYGISAKTISLDEYIMKKNLDNGSMLICSVGPGDFTAAGHFIVIYGYEDGMFLVNDPNCVERSGKRWSFEELSHQIRGLWSYSV